MPRFLSLLLAFCCALASAAPARADLLMPGWRRIEHTLVIERAELPAGTRLVAAPTRGFGGMHAIEFGEPFDFSSKYGTRVYLVAAEETLTDRADEAWKAGHRSTTIPVTQVSSVPLTSPLESVRTTLRLAALDGERFELAVVGEDRRYDAKLATLLVGLVLAGIGALVWLRRRRRRAAAGEPTP